MLIAGVKLLLTYTWLQNQRCRKAQIVYQRDDDLLNDNMNKDMKGQKQETGNKYMVKEHLSYIFLKENMGWVFKGSSVGQFSKCFREKTNLKLLLKVTWKRRNI